MHTLKDKLTVSIFLLFINIMEWFDSQKLLLYRTFYALPEGRSTVFSFSLRLVCLSATIYDSLLILLCKSLAVIIEESRKMPEF